MEVLCAVLVALVFVSQAGVIDNRSLADWSSLIEFTAFLHNAMRAAGSGCQVINKYITGPVCTALSTVPEETQVEACGVYTVGYGVCLGVIEGSRTYCSFPTDTAICSAIHKYGK